MGRDKRLGKSPDDVITAQEIACWVYCPEAMAAGVRTGAGAGEPGGTGRGHAAS